MAAGVINQPLRIEKGTTVSRIITLTAGGVAVDLTGCSATFHLRAGTPQSPGAILLNCDTAATRLSIYGLATAGKFRCVFSAADTAALTAQSCFQELFVTFSDNSVERPLVRYAVIEGTGANP